jgi:serine/threonine-protein kinase
MAREAHAAARMGHPALVRVFDFGWTSRGDPYLVMELVQGETLSALLGRESRVNAIRAVQMILPIADGLRVAHDKHIIHRDIKPDNIFLATDALGRTQPKLLDFGIAKVDQTAHDGKLTQVGAVLGSPEYMSPEQALGADDMDERTDVWSLSVVLYELITGTVPFSKSNYNALMQTIIHDAPTPMPEHAAGDTSLWLVVERGLAKQREQRWANMTEFGEALALWLYEHGIKEDLSGNSIRAVWLDGALSGVRADIPSSVPPSRRQYPAEAITQNAPKRSSFQALAAARNIQGRGKQKQVFIIALALGVGLGGIAVALALGGKNKPGNADLALGSASVAVATPTPNATKLGLSTAGEPAPDQSAQPMANIAQSSAPAADVALTIDTISPKRTAPKAAVLPNRSASKNSKRTHDFGF